MNSISSKLFGRVTSTILCCLCSMSSCKREGEGNLEVLRNIRPVVAVQTLKSYDRAFTELILRGREVGLSLHRESGEGDEYMVGPLIAQDNKADPFYTPLPHVCGEIMVQVINESSVYDYMAFIASTYGMEIHQIDRREFHFNWGKQYPNQSLKLTPRVDILSVVRERSKRCVCPETAPAAEPPDRGYARETGMDDALNEFNSLFEQRFPHEQLLSVEEVRAALKAAVTISNLQDHSLNYATDVVRRCLNDRVLPIGSRFSIVKGDRPKGGTFGYAVILEFGLDGIREQSKTPPTPEQLAPLLRVPIRINW